MGFLLRKMVKQFCYVPPPLGEGTSIGIIVHAAGNVKRIFLFFIFCDKTFRLRKNFDGSCGLNNDIESAFMGKIDDIFRNHGTDNRTDKTFLILGRTLLSVPGSIRGHFQSSMEWTCFLSFFEMLSESRLQNILIVPWRSNFSRGKRILSLSRDCAKSLENCAKCVLLFSNRQRTVGKVVGTSSRL